MDAAASPSSLAVRHRPGLRPAAAGRPAHGGNGWPPFFTYHYFTGDPGDSISRAVAISVGVFLIATVLSFVLAIAGKMADHRPSESRQLPVVGPDLFSLVVRQPAD